MKPAHLLCSLIIWLFAFPAFAQFPDKQKLDDRIAEYVNGIAPGLAVGIVQDGIISYEHYAGYAELDHEVKVGPQTRFNIASCAKQFTALCILRLAAEGKLQLDDDIRTYLPEMYADRPDKITITHLLNHSSGIRDISRLLGLQGKAWWKLFQDNDDAIELLQKQRDLNFPPGTDYTYSNSNYLFLAEIVARVTKQDFQAYALETFQALGMHETDFITHYGKPVPNRARPYGNYNGWIQEPSVNETHGDGNLFTTLRDQLQWELVLQGKGKTSISKKILRQSQQPIPGATIQQYGFGLEFDVHKGLDYTFHNGGSGSYHATFVRFPSEALSIVIMSNNGRVSTVRLINEILDMILGPEETVERTYPAGPDTIAPFQGNVLVIGEYMARDNSIIRIVEKAGTLYREIKGRDPVRLMQENESMFSYETLPDLKLVFSTGENGKAAFTLYMASQPPSRYERIPDFPVEAVYFTELNGIYHNSETGVSLEVVHQEGDRFQISRNGRIFESTLLAKDLLQMRDYELTVKRNGNQIIEGLLLSNDRLANVLFERQ